MSYDDEIIEDSGLLNQDQNEHTAWDDEVALAAIRGTLLSMEEFAECMRVLAIPEGWEAILAAMWQAAEAGRRLREQYPEGE